MAPNGSPRQPPMACLERLCGGSPNPTGRPELALMPTSPTRSPAFVRLWIIACAYLNCVGWILSWLRWLTPSGYAVAMLIGLGGIVLFRGKLLGSLPLWPPHLRPQRRRFSRLFPLSFLIVATLAILGGVLHAPSNADALTHRLPRLLNWFAEGGWYWMSKVPFSFNTRSCGFEWLMAPMVSLMRTDRWIFLINSLSFLLMPGLVFGVFTRLGVAKQVAWHWMWLAPTGYCFVLQAGSIGNDAMGAMFGLAALDFALRARANRRTEDAWLSVLAAALLSSSKTSNLPLLLPWLIALWPSLPLLWRRPLGSSVVAIVALLASFFPTAALNWHYVRDWTGGSYELPKGTWEAKPQVAFVGNVLNLTVQNLVPPVFPAARWWNENAHKALPARLAADMKAGFEPGGARLFLQDLQIETSAGLGFGVTLLTLVSCLGALWFGLPRPPPSSIANQGLLRWVRYTPLISILVYMCKATLSTSARIIAPYYCLMLPMLLTWKGHSILVRRRWWRGMALGVFAIAAGLLIVNPGRPLWPANTILNRVDSARTGTGILGRARQIYASYAVRPDALAAIRNALPIHEKRVGLISFLTSTTLETSLWRPFGSRRVLWLEPEDSLSEINRLGIRYVVIAADTLTAPARGVPFRDWVASWAAGKRGKILCQVTASHVASSPPSPWYVVELPGDEPRAASVVRTNF